MPNCDVGVTGCCAPTPLGALACAGGIIKKGNCIEGVNGFKFPFAAEEVADFPMNTLLFTSGLNCGMVVEVTVVEAVGVGADCNVSLECVVELGVVPVVTDVDVDVMG